GATALRNRSAGGTSVRTPVRVPGRWGRRVAARLAARSRLTGSTPTLVRPDRGRLLPALGRRRRLLLRRSRILTWRWPRFTALHRLLARRLDRRLLGGPAIAELVEHRDPRPFLHRGEDPLQVLTLQRLLLQHLTHQVVQHLPIVVQDVPCLGVCGFDQFADFLVDLVGNLE